MFTLHPGITHSLPEGYPIHAQVEADSINDRDCRLTTLSLYYPRYIHQELMTHRVFSRNASSSRAIPTKKIIQAANDQFVMPSRWGVNQAGMQPGQANLSPEDQAKAEAIWRRMADECMKGALELAELGVHKQWCSRPVEWFSTIRVVVTATQSAWEGFFLLRDHPAAQDEIVHLARSIKEAMNVSSPKRLKVGEYHLPFISDSDKTIPVEDQLKVSAARCARVSYKTFDGKVSSLEEDLLLCSKLTHDFEGDDPAHMSPFEHQARNLLSGEAFGSLSGNFDGSWVQWRKELEMQAYGP